MASKPASKKRSTLWRLPLVAGQRLPPRRLRLQPRLRKRAAERPRPRNQREARQLLNQRHHRRHRARKRLGGRPRGSPRPPPRKGRRGGEARTRRGCCKSFLEECSNRLHAAISRGGGINPPRYRRPRLRHSQRARWLALGGRGGAPLEKFNPKLSVESPAPGSHLRPQRSEPLSPLHEPSPKVFPTRNQPGRLAPDDAGWPGQVVSSNPVIRLQRAVGNRATGRWLGSHWPQAKRYHRSADDLVERKAGRIAEPMMQLQRACACGGECDECRKKQQLGLQAKLTVGKPGDIYEQEADRIADQVISPPAQTAPSRVPACRSIQHCGRTWNSTSAGTFPVCEYMLIRSPRSQLRM